MKSNEILKFLNFNADNYPSFEINNVAALVEGAHNCLIFYKQSDYGALIESLKLKDNLILAAPIPEDKTPLITEKDGNIVVVVDDPRYVFAQIVYKFNIRKLFNAPEPTNYKQILKSSKVVSKSAVIYNAVVGEGCAFHHNVLIGIDDFTPMRSSDGKETLMFPQLGMVKIGNNVSIYSNSIVGRGALSITEIGDNTKIDALCQVGHNCIVGKNCMITAGTIIAGSCKIGNNVFIGVGSHIRNGVTIGNNVTIGQGSNVVSDIPDNAVVMGNPAKVIRYNDPEHQATSDPVR